MEQAASVTAPFLPKFDPTGNGNIWWVYTSFLPLVTGQNGAPILTRPQHDLNREPTIHHHIKIGEAPKRRVCSGFPLEPVNQPVTTRAPTISSLRGTEGPRRRLFPSFRAQGGAETFVELLGSLILLQYKMPPKRTNLGCSSSKGDSVTPKTSQGTS